MLQFKTLTLLFLLLSLQSFGQTVIKRSFFGSHALGTCKDTSEIVRVSLDADHAQLKVYTWTGLYGSIDLKFPNGEKPKTAKAKIGKFMKEQTTINAANNNDKVVYPDIACLAVRRLTFEDIMTTGDFGTDNRGVRDFYENWHENPIPFDRISHQTVYPRPMTPGVTYIFEPNDKCGQVTVHPEKITLIDPAGLATQYPDLGLGNTHSAFEMAYKGEGMLGMSNKKNSILHYDYAYQVDSFKVQLNEGVKEDRPNKETLPAILGEYQVWDFKDAQLQLDEHKRFVMLRGDKSGDKWSNYNHYKLVLFTDAGQVLAQTECTTEFLRDLKYFGFAYDKTGKPAGVIAFFSNFAMMGAKSRRDPNDNNHELWYFGLDGKEKFHYTFTHGDDKDNKRSINPVLVIDNNGTLEMLGANLAKIFKAKSEIVKFNDKGQISAELVEGQAVSTYNLPTYGRYTTTTMLEDGNFMIVQAEPSEGSPSNGAAGFVIVSPDLKVLTGYHMENATPSVPVVDYLGKFGNDYKFVITLNGRNHFISRGENKVDMTLPAPTDKGVYLPKTMLGANYVVDKPAKKIYSFYQHTGGNGLGYVMVIGL